MGQITHEDLNVNLSEEIKESTRLSKSNEGKIKEQEEKTASLPELKTDFEVHISQIASTEKLGHIKVDGDTISVDPVTGIATSLAKGMDVKSFTGDLNDLTDIGFYFVNSPTNAPTSQGWVGRAFIRVLQYETKAYVEQTFYYVNNTNGTGTSRRVMVNNIWGQWHRTDVTLNNTLTSTSTTEVATANAVKQINDKIDGVPVNLPIMPPFGTTFAEFNPRMSSVGSMVGVDGSVKVIASLSSNEIVRLPSGYFPRTDFPVVLRKQRGSSYERIDGVVNGTGSVLVASENLSKLATNDILFFNFTFLKK